MYSLQGLHVIIGIVHTEWVCDAELNLATISQQRISHCLYLSRKLEHATLNGPFQLKHISLVEGMTLTFTTGSMVCNGNSLMMALFEVCTPSMDN